MDDPKCKVCSPGPCVHGEQSVASDEREIDCLRDKVRVLAAENARVRLHEREACAALADRGGAWKAIAAAIRARGGA